MSTAHPAPPAPRLAAIRHRWLVAVTEGLRADPAVTGAALVGSLGAGRHDDWSDVDLLVVVDDGRLDEYAGPGRLPAGPGGSPLTFDARHNGPRGTRAFSQQRVIDGLPLWIDWYVVPAARAAWVADSKVVFDRRGFALRTETYAEHYGVGEREPALPARPEEHRRLRLAMVPVAGKYLARRSPDAAALTEFVGGTAGTADVAALRALLDGFADLALPRNLAAAHAYLDVVEDALR